MNERLGRQILIGLGIGLLAIWLMREVWGILSAFSPVLALFFSAWLISFVLSPPTDLLVRLGVRRPLAVLAVYFIVFGLLGIGVLLMTPLLVGQLGQLLDVVNSARDQTPAMLTWFGEQVRAWGGTDADLRDFYRSAVDQVRAISGTALQNALGWLTGAASLLVNIIFCLIISVYIMLDGQRIVTALLALVPRSLRGELGAVLQSIGDNFGGYIRGQIILSVIYAISIAIAMSVAHLDYKTICAIFAGVAMLIPFIGPFVSLVPPILIAFFSSPGDVWWITLLLVAVQQVVLNVVGPRVFGQAVNMHPLLVIGAALMGAAVAGIWGALFGIPVVGILASAFRRVYELRAQPEPPSVAEEVEALSTATSGPIADPSDPVPASRQ